MQATMCNKFTKDDREEIHRNFWQMGDYSRQNKWLSKYVEKRVKKVSTCVDSRRKFSNSYYLPKHGENVCKYS